jgi:hypothetical protein
MEKLQHAAPYNLLIFWRKELLQGKNKNMFVILLNEIAERQDPELLGRLNVV